MAPDTDLNAHETLIAALSLVAGHYTNGLADRSRYGNEFLHFLRHRWGLSAGQEKWCRTLLAEADGSRLDVAGLLSRAGRWFGAEDRLLFCGLLSWFLNEAEGGDWHSPPRGLFPGRALQAFALLQIPPTLDPQEVRGAFRRAIRLLHPDVLPDLGLTPEERTQAQTLATQVIEARDVLQEFHRGLALPGRGPGTRGARTISESFRRWIMPFINDDGTIGGRKERQPTEPSRPSPSGGGGGDGGEVLGAIIGFFFLLLICSGM